MAPKKQAKPNSFVLFAQDLQKQHGRKYPTLKEAVSAAGPLWDRMSKEQRQPYDDKAKQLKGQSHPTRYTSDGYDVEVLTRKQDLENKAAEAARQEIRNIITMAQRKDALDSEVFFLIHCNIFCYYSKQERFWPAEIAILCFTLKDGVKIENICHYVVNPGPLPIGYKFEAKQHSDGTHLIEVPLDDSTDNMEEVYYGLKAFLEKKKPAGTKRMPILYAHKTYESMIRNILNTWNRDYDSENDLFRVYNLQTMFCDLRNTVAGDQVWTSLSFSDRELEKDVYGYYAGLACQYHAGSKPVYCSKSIVQRYAFTICDNCCSDLNIVYIEGQHVPVASLIPDSLSSYGSTSSRSTRSERFSRRGFNDEYETESNSETWDTESLASNASTTSTLQSNKDYPPLEKGGFPSQSSNFSNSIPTNSPSVKSYAGATVKSNLPHAFEKSMGQLSLHSSSGAKGGKGSGRAIDSDSDASVVGAKAGSTSGAESFDYPPLGRGRGGFRRKNL